MTELDFIKHVTKNLERAYMALEGSPWIGPPEWITSENQFRHQRKHDCLLIYLKGIRTVSLLNASVVLLEAGYVHEVGILCRCIDEAIEDMIFFIRNLGENSNPTESQEKILKEFFQEQFADPMSPLGSSIKRDRVPRRKVRATIAGLPENEVNPHDHVQLTKTVYDTFSGYVHGAYPHIMELYGGQPARFHMTGMANTPRTEEWQRQLIDYAYRGILGAWFTARRLGEDGVAAEVFSLRQEFERRYPHVLGEPNELIKKIKKGEH